jgi:hypothetical protein
MWDTLITMMFINFKNRATVTRRLNDGSNFGGSDETDFNFGDDCAYNFELCIG